MTAGGDTSWPWPAPADDGACDHLRGGGVAVPDVTLAATAGGSIRLAGLAHRAVVFVYPFMGGPVRPNPPGWDDIPGAHGSTPQAEGYQRLAQVFADRGIPVFGLSGQAIADQCECAGRLGLSFPLIHDGDGLFASGLGLPTFTAGEGRYLRRVTLVLDQGGVAAVRYPVHPPDRDADEVVALLAAGEGSALRS